MNTGALFSFFVGLALGGIIIGCLVWVITLIPKDRKVIEVGLKNTLPSHEFVPFEWVYFHMELSPKDMPTLRHVLEEYTEEGLVDAKIHNGVPVYKLGISVLA